MLKTTCFHNNEYASLWSCICFCCVCICLYVRFSTDPCFPSELQWVSESNLVSVDWIDQCKDLLYSFDQAASVVYSDKRVMEFVFISSLLTEDIFVYHCIHWKWKVSFFQEKCIRCVQQKRCVQWNKCVSQNRWFPWCVRFSLCLKSG